MSERPREGVPGRVLRLLMIDALHPVRVPTVEEEALRDWHTRESIRDLMLSNRPQRGSATLDL